MDTGARQIRVSRAWLQLLKELPQTGRVMVVGGSDSGKTTLCQWLLSKLPAEARPALVDSDTGQSQVGPPACVGWRFAGTSQSQLFFVGDITPAANPSGVLAATVRSVLDAEAAGAGLVLVDTSGYLSGRGGFELKSGKLELLSTCGPQACQSALQVITVGESPEIKRLLAAWHRDERLVVHRLPTAETMQQKSRPQRMEWRRAKFAEYFAGTELRKVSLERLALSGLATSGELQAAGKDWNDLEGLLLGFYDTQRRVQCLGILKRLDLRGREMLVRAPETAEQAVGVTFGTLRVTAEGQEIGRIT
ncbi:MAG: Clp1/GlmU family protein [Armatimonadia bacterium]